MNISIIYVRIYNSILLFWKKSGIVYLPLGQRILYYNAMIKQTMIYGSSVWVSTPVDNLNGVFRLQKCAVCVIHNADTRANSVDLFRELNWLPFLVQLRFIGVH